MAAADTMKPAKDAVALVYATDWGTQWSGVGKYAGGLTSQILTAEEYDFIWSLLDDAGHIEKHDHWNKPGGGQEGNSSALASRGVADLK